MTLEEVRRLLTGMSDEMDASTDKVVASAELAQTRIYNALRQRIFDFEISDGRFIANQDYSSRFALIQREMMRIINSLYKPSITEYLNTYTTVDETNAFLHAEYNKIEIDKPILTGARATIYKQAEYYLLKDGLASDFVTPASYVLLQAVQRGLTIKQTESLLRNWNDGQMKAGSNISSARPSPRLQAYAGQIAVDSIYQYNGAIQERIAEQYGLTRFIYVGGLVKDSRELCIHLVKQRRKISLDEIPELIKKYPKGVIPNTTKDNFPVRRGGFRCNHTVMMVR